MHTSLLQYDILALAFIVFRVLATTPARPSGLPPDHEGNITCVGDKYDLDLPMINGFNPNLLSMQQICALPQYGGMPDQHIGGWCDASSLDMRSWHLSFDISPASGANQLLANPRVMLACFYRCWCNYGGDLPVVHHPLGNSEIVKTKEGKTHAITIDVVSDFSEPWQNHLNPSRSTFYERWQVIDLALPLPQYAVGVSDEIINSTRLYYRSYPWTTSSRHPTYNDGSPAIHVAMNKDNRIQCRGDLPRFPFPGSHRQQEFENLQSLCAVQSSGGKA